MKNQPLHCVLTALFSIVISAGITSADTVTLTPTSAFRILTESPTAHDPSLVSVYNIGANVQHGILKFNFSSIPAGATISSAILTLRTTGFAQPPGTQSEVFAIAGPWDNTASWLNASPGVPWSTPGGDVTGAAYAVNSDNISGSNTPVDWNVTSLVTVWYAGFLTNYGMLLTGTPGNTLHFDPAGTALTIIFDPNDDADHDGIKDQYETGTGIYVSPTDMGTSPTNADTDGDGLKDGTEINVHHTNPNVADTDGDGFSDGFELNSGFDPVSALSTPDALTTLRPAREFRFNAANGVSYRIEGSTDTVNWTTVENNITGAGVAVTRFYAEADLGPRYFLRVRRN